MFRKIILYAFHIKPLCSKVDPLLHFGWKHNSIILSEIQSSQLFGKKEYEQNFLKNAQETFPELYNMYYSDEKFMDYNMTTPSLSIQLDFLKSEREINDKKRLFYITEANIYDAYIENTVSPSNHKILGYFEKKEALSEIYYGMIGPEQEHVWRDSYQKQVVKTIFICNQNQYFNIVWEKNLKKEYPTWKISNINNIVLD